jgi:hypothetical protein
VVCCIDEEREYNEWYNSLTPEEQESVYNDKIHTYEVLSVNQYVRTETNRYGGVMDTDICYTFTYLDSDGTLKSVQDFENIGSNSMQVTVGDKDVYIVNENSDGGKTLQLTKETLSKIQLTQNG